MGKKKTNSESSQDSTAYNEISLEVLEEPRIVAIGASAGGLEALKEFFDNVPSDCPYSFVVVQHLSPDYKSLMAELLAKNTSMPIYEIQHSMEINKGCIYLIPPKKNMTILNGRLMLTNKPNGHDLNLPIDIFFRSLAQECKDKSICIILSGTGSDGTSGARAIKEVGGMVMVQDPSQAKFDGMPRSALNTGLVDYTLPVEQLPGELIHFVNHPKSNGASENQIEQDKETLNRIIHQIRNITQFDFRYYKRPTLVRRIARRIGINKLHNQKEYLDFLFENPSEVHILAREFLIGVTRFFRDTYVWEKLEKQIIPDIIKSKNDGDLLKLWCVGTSTGEEAYSMAILISEELERQGKTLEVKIFATDVANKFLEIGSRGVYAESIIANVSQERLNKFFIRKMDEYQVVDSIRRMVIFSQHDIVRDPPFNKMDIAVCRNLLIYYEPIAQRKIVGLLHYSLNLNGVLLLGSSETLGDYKNVMKELDRKGKIYQNIKPSRSLGIEPLQHPDIQRVSPTSSQTKPNVKFDNRLRELMNDTVAEELGLAGVFVDENYNILHAVGEFSKFIELPKKGFSINLLKMFPASISVSISSAVRKALKANERMLYKSMKLHRNEKVLPLNLLVSPFQLNNVTNDKGCLLLFMPKKEETGSAKVISEMTGENHRRVSELEEELHETRQNLQTVVEEIETSNEELQATNEELLAANEELQSTNEELQSVNEELHTVNAELQQKIEDLASLNNDMDNLLTSTGIGTIFLDRDMNIRKFTPTVMEHFNLREIDINRPIYHFANNFGLDDDLYEKVQKVLDTGESSQQEVQSFKGDWFLKRITPYLNNQNVIDGVVISFVDINEQKEAQKEFYYKNKAFEQLLEGNMAGFWDRMIQENTEYLSPSLKEMFGYEDHEMKNVPESWQKIVHPDDLPEIFDAYRKHVESKGEYPYDYSVRYYHKDGSIVWIYCIGKVIEWDKKGNPVRMVGCHVDITPIKTIEQDLYRSNRELEQFAYIASHDLQEPLNTIKDFVKLFTEEYSDKLNDNGHQYIEFISQAANRMGNLVKGVLGYSRIGQSSEITSIDCNEIIEDIQIDLHKRIKDTQTSFDVKKLPTLKGYHIELNSLFLNLISNSMKFRKPGQKPKISISVTESAQFWEFTFKDNGIGIEKKNKDKVFNIFQRLNNMDSYEGTGIGLAQCKKIVELHGGKIWVDSVVGKGSTFHFTLKK